MKKIKLMADYHCYPLWVMDEGEVGNLSPEFLPISDALKVELDEWANQYDLTLNMDDPLTSGFASEEAEVRFYQEGNILKNKLQDELGPQYYVFYIEHLSI